METFKWANPEEARAADYLLGRLDEPSRSAFEVIYLSTEHQQDFIRSVELDLIEAYLDDTLSAPDRTSFTSHYLISPGNRRQLELVRGLAKKCVPASRSYPGVWSVATAAGVALVSLAVWQYQENRSLRHENIILRARPQAAVYPPPAPHLPRQVTLFAGSVRQAGGDVVSVAPMELIVRFVLVPDGLISPGTPVRAVLSSVSPEPIAVLPAKLDAEGRVVVDCPVGALSAGQYLWSIEAGGQRSRTYSVRLEFQNK